MKAEPLAAADFDAVTEIAHEANLTVDPRAEAHRVYSNAWVVRSAPSNSVVAFLVAWDVADDIELLHVATTKRFRRQGAARKLVEALLRHARRRHARHVSLEVRRSNHPAIGLYRSLGFRAIGIRRDYYAKGREDAIEMRLTLDPDSGLVQPGSDDVSLEEDE